MKNPEKSANETDLSAFYDPRSNKAIMDAYTKSVELMKNNGTHPTMIFIAAHDNQVIEAFEVNVNSNAVKHMDPSRFVITTSHTDAEDDNFTGSGLPAKTVKDYIFVRSKSVFTKIRICDISYIQACGDYVNIFAGEKRYTIHLTLRAIEEKLPEGMFYRLHRSYLVSLDHIDNVEENTAYVGKHPIAISVQFKKELLNRLNVI
ncbi:MAG: LytR/AlgR family response regulator transcription factor [Bacteroidia bacterium]